MIVTWSGKLFTLRVSRCDFERDNEKLNQPEASIVTKVIIVAAGEMIVDGSYPGADSSGAVRPIEIELYHRRLLDWRSPGYCLSIYRSSPSIPSPWLYTGHRSIPGTSSVHAAFPKRSATGCLSLHRR